MAEFHFASLPTKAGARFSAEAKSKKTSPYPPLCFQKDVASAAKMRAGAVGTALSAVTHERRNAAQKEMRCWICSLPVGQNQAILIRF